MSGYPTSKSNRSTLFYDFKMVMPDDDCGRLTMTESGIGQRAVTADKSPHKLRKTCLSTLLDCPNISDRTVQRFAGHSDIATTHKYYSFERRSKEEQAKAIDAALAL